MKKHLRETKTLDNETGATVTVHYEQGEEYATINSIILNKGSKEFVFNKNGIAVSQIRPTVQDMKFAGRILVHAIEDTNPDLFPERSAALYTAAATLYFAHAPR